MIGTRISKKEFVKYAVNHNDVECSRYFDITPTTSQNYRIRYGLNNPEWINILDKEEFVKYYTSHTSTETAKHFKLSHTYVSLASIIFGCQKFPCNTTTRLLNDKGIKKANFVAYMKNHTITETKNHFNLTLYEVNCLRELWDCDYKHRGELYETEEFLDFAKDHTSKEIAKKFGLRDYQVRSACNRLGIPFVRQTAHKNSLPKVGRNEMIRFLAPHFAYADIAEVFGMTVVRVHQIVKSGTIEAPHN